VPPALPPKNDQIFQLTLTELAFMLVFLMMLITGWMVLEADKRTGETAGKLKQAELALKKSTEDAQVRQKADKSLQAQLDALKGSPYRPADVISDLKKCSALEPENSGLKIRIAELEKQTGVLSAFLETMKTMTLKEAIPAITEEVASAMAFKKGFEDASGRRLDSRNAAQQGLNCVAALAKTDGMEKERQNLINQVTFMRRQLESLNGTKGFGLPPCWVDNSGKVQRLIAVEVTDQGLVVRPGWPAERNEDAKNLPNLQSLIGGGKPQSVTAFHNVAMPVLEWGQKRNPECRFYASVTVSATRVDTSVAGQNAVFDHFFPYGKVSIQKDGR
jgi:hypothetical protein